MIFAAFATALLTGMGVGSGGIFVVYLTLMAGLPQLTAQCLNLYFFIFSIAAALIIHTRTHSLPLLRLAMICAVGGVGCFFGGFLAKTLDSGMLRSIFAVLLILSGIVSLLKKKQN